MMKPEPDGTLPTFMDVAGRVLAMLQIFGDNGACIFPGTDVCPHDDSFRAWYDDQKAHDVLECFWKPSDLKDNARPTVYDVAKFILIQDQMRISQEPPPWMSPEDSFEESVDAFAEELGAHPSRVDREVYAMLCNLRSVEDVIKSPLLTRSSKANLLKSYKRAQQSGACRMWSTQGLNRPVIVADDEEARTALAQIKVTSGPKRGLIIAETGLCAAATRNKWYQFCVAPSGTCSFAGMREENVPDAVCAEMRAAAASINALLVSREEKAKADRSHKLAAEHARQTARNKSESNDRRAIRAAANHAKATREEAPYSPSGSSHKSPKPGPTRRTDDVTRAKRAAEADEGRGAEAAHTRALRDKEAMRVQQLEEQREYRRVATAIQRGD